VRLKALKRAIDQKAPQIYQVAGLVLLLGVVVLFFLRRDVVREYMKVARDTSRLVNSDDDFYKCGPAVGVEYPVLERLKKDYPQGTAVCLPMDVRLYDWIIAIRMALYPPFTFSPDSELVICAVDRTQFGDVLLARGRNLVLVRRKRGGGK
jgi:hypothetical protein